MGEAPRVRAPRRRPRFADAAPRILLAESTFEHRPLGCEPLTDRDQAKLRQAREGRQIGAVKGSVGHVEVFQMASVRTSIIGRPRRLSRHRRAHPTPSSYPLICEEPLAVVKNLSYVGKRRSLGLCVCPYTYEAVRGRWAWDRYAKREKCPLVFYY